MKSTQNSIDYDTDQQKVGFPNNFDSNQKTEENQNLLGDLKEQTQGLSLQQAYAKIGGFSYFQYWASLVFIWGFTTGGCLFYALSFLEKQPRYLCFKQDGSTYECLADVFCNDPTIKHEVDWNFDSSLHNWVEDLDLTCKIYTLLITIFYVGVSSAKIGLIGSIYFIGWTTAAFILPRLSDLYGRKKIYLFAMTGHLIMYIGIIVSRNLNLTIAFMYFFGFFSLGRASVGYLYMTELTPAKQQTLVGTILQIFNGAITIAIALYFLYVSKWWMPFQIFCCATNFLIVLSIIPIPESPKYLISKKKYDEARKALSIIARINRYKGSLDFKFDREVIEYSRSKINHSVSTLSISQEKSKHHAHQNQNNLKSHGNHQLTKQEELDLLKSPITVVKEEQQLNGTLKDLVKIRRHFINLMIMVMIWLASSFDYYLINFQLKYIHGDFFVNTIVASACEIPAYILGGIVYQKLGIKAVLISCFAISVVGGILLIIFADQENIIPVFILLARFGVSATFNIAYLANAQIFPTIFAGTAFGICNIFAKMATILSPMLAEVNPPVPMICFVIVAGIACIVSFFIITAKEVEDIDDNQIEDNSASKISEKQISDQEL